MFFSESRKFPIYPTGRDVFRKRLAESLRKRMYPNTGLHPKQLAHALGKSTDTIFHWLRAENAAEGDSIDGLLNFFVSQGDPSFLTEVFPGVIPLVQVSRKAERALQLVQGFAQFAALDEVAA